MCGYGEPGDYFSIFRNWVLDDQSLHRWYRNSVVTLVDDHDQVRKGSAKLRFCGDSRFRDLAFNVVATQLTTMGIPCIYYGTEQGFDSGGRPSSSDLVLRESMFGGRFGGKCTQGRHFFDEDAGLYKALAALIDLRKKLLPLRRGRQMLHQISGDGIDFGVPRLSANGCARSSPGRGSSWTRKSWSRSAQTRSSRRRRTRRSRRVSARRGICCA